MKIAFLGLGAMGMRMAKHLLGTEHALTVYNRSTAKSRCFQESGAQIALSPAEAVTDADLVLSMVSDDGASRDLWLTKEGGVISTLKPRTICIECSTLTISWVKELAAILETKQARFLDAPVLGSLAQAEAAQLIFLVGGDQGLAEKIAPVLKLMGSSVHSVGANGRGAAMKLAVNGYFGIQVAAFAEMIHFLRREHFEDATLMETVSSFPVISPAIKGIGALMALNDISPKFPIHLVEKDIRYLLSEAEENRMSMPMAQKAHHLYLHAKETGLGDKNISAIELTYR